MNSVNVVGSVGMVEVSKSLLNVLMSTRSTEAERYVLAGIQVKREDNVVTIATCDTFQLTVVSIDNEGEDFEVILTKREFANRIVSKGTSIKPAKIDLINLLDDERFNIDGKYPNWKTVIPEDCEQLAVEFHSDGVNTHSGCYNLGFLKSIQNLMEEEGVKGYIKDNPENDPVKFSGENFIYVVSPIRPRN